MFLILFLFDHFIISLALSRVVCEFLSIDTLGLVKKSSKLSSSILTFLSTPDINKSLIFLKTFMASGSSFTQLRLLFLVRLHLLMFQNF